MIIVYPCDACVNTNGFQYLVKKVFDLDEPFGYYTPDRLFTCSETIYRLEYCEIIIGVIVIVITILIIIMVTTIIYRFRRTTRFLNQCIHVILASCVSKYFIFL